MDKPHSQRDDRGSLNATDQFGRSWLYTYETKTLEQTGEMRPAGWTDPLRTPIKYLIVPKQPGTSQPMFGTIRVLFAEWIADTKRAMDDWQQNLWNVGQDLFKGAFKSTQELEEDPRVVKQAGPKPWPSHDALVAASRGHKGLLGIVPPMLPDGRPNLDPLAVEARQMLGIVYLEDLSAAPVEGVPAPVIATSLGDYRTFVADAMRAGKTMAEAAALWNSHKANLKEAPDAPARR